MAKIDITNPEKSKEAPQMSKQPSLSRKWKNPNIFAGGLILLLLLILTPVIVFSIMNQNSLMALVTSLKGDVTSLKQDVAFLTGYVTSLKRDMACLTGDVTSLKGDMASLKWEMRYELWSLREVATDDAATYDFAKDDAVTLNGFCPDGWLKVNENCYYLSDKTSNFTEAKNFCLEKHARIFEPRNNNIIDMIKDALKGEEVSPFYWIGMVKEGDRCIGSSDQIPIQCNNWKWMSDKSSVSSNFYNLHLQGYSDHSPPNCGMIHLDQERRRPTLRT